MQVPSVLICDGTPMIVLLPVPSREFPMGKTGSDASVDFQEVRLWKDYWGYFSVAAKLDAVW
jgi:hypothetical protein